jgi:hypothetical protein
MASRRVWDWPFDFRSDFLPVQRGCAPIYDEIARRASNFITDAVSSDSSVVRFMANQASNSAKARSSIGRNAMLCCLRYGCMTFQQSFACRHKRTFIDSRVHNLKKMTICSWNQRWKFSWFETVCWQDWSSHGVVWTSKNVNALFPVTCQSRQHLIFFSVCFDVCTFARFP